MVILGTPSPDSSKLYAITVTEGDPTWAGALAGEALKLPVFHITEPEIKGQVDSTVYESEVGMAELVLDAEAIAAAIREVREGNGTA